MSINRQIITDTLVVEKTGKTLEDWFVFLDKNGAQKLSHLEIFTLVSKTPDLEPLGEWNQNLLTTSYEWSRGIKERGQKGDEFEISVSKTVNVPIGVLYKNLIDPILRNRWLPKETIVIRKATENKSARITWSDGETSLSVDFYPKSESKAQIVVQHQKIRTSAFAQEMKVYWGDKLEELKIMLEA